MAERRMFAKTIIDSDAFLDMPTSARLLYFDLGMRADDDGFINAPKKIMRMTGSSDDDMRLLIAKKFVIPFENGVVVIKHWKIHNYIRTDRYVETKYKEQKALLTLDENNAYTLDTTCLPVGIPSVNQVSGNWDTQVRLGKDRLELGKESIEIEEVKHAPPPKAEEKETPKKELEKIHFAEFVTMTNDEYEKLVVAHGKELTDQCIQKLDNYKGSNGKKYKSDYRAILSWVLDEVKKSYKPITSTNAQSSGNPFKDLLMQYERGEQNEQERIYADFSIVESGISDDV